MKLLKTSSPIPKPYTCELSKKYPGIEIQYEGDSMFLCPLNSNNLHNKIKDALNGAFLMGALYGNQNKI